MSLRHVPEKVITCYDLLDAALAGGVEDFTEGKYYGNGRLSYFQAQKNQAEWLLDQIKCKKGSYILDVGCGNGRILEAAKNRGAHAIGITISKHQVGKCKKRKLRAVLMNYVNIPKGWNNRFDGIIANGSIEHFVQVKDALKNKQDKIYKEMFKVFHRILKPGGYLASTVIHFNQVPNPDEIIKGSKSFEKYSSNYHFFKILLEDFGGWYPVPKQLERCSAGLFKHLKQEDGTEDYRRTSEYWLSAMKKQICKNPKVWVALLGKLISKPKPTIRMLDNLIISQSWMWQFRKQKGKTPTRLFRDVWEKIN